MRTLAFSFTGLVTAIERLISSIPNSISVSKGDGAGNGSRDGQIGENVKREVARVFQDTAVGHVCDKVGLALRGLDLGGMGGLVVSGGVACNQVLRER